MLRTHHGVATAEMLRQTGVGRHVRERLVDAGVLEVVYERVFRIRSAPDTEVARSAAICLAYPHAYITGPSGGRLTMVRRMPKDDEVHVGISHGCNIGPIDGVRLRQTRNLQPGDVQGRRPDGIRLASAPRLAFDLGADLSPADHASVVEQLLQERRCTFASLLITARRLIHPQRPGSLVVAGTLDARGDRAAVDSHPELQVADALRALDVPVDVVQMHLDLPNGGRARLDIAVPGIRWGIEVDVHPDHLLLEGTTRDKARDRQCHLIDWQIERVTKLDLVDLPGLAVELKALYMARLTARRAA